MHTKDLKGGPRAGFSFLEHQVAFVVFGIALAGMGPLVVMQLRQTRTLEERFDNATTYYLVPSGDPWARKLGAEASIETADPGPAPPPPVMVIDNGEAGYSESGPEDWHGHARAAFNGNLRCHNAAGGGSNTASWEYTGLTPGRYEVLVTWLEKYHLATNAPYTVYDGVDPQGTVLVNQKLSPSGDVIDGRPWQSLGVFTVGGTVLRVVLSDDANEERVIADGARIVPWKNDVQVVSLDKSLTSEEMTAHVSVTVVVPP